MIEGGIHLNIYRENIDISSILNLRNLDWGHIKTVWQEALEYSPDE